MKPTSPMGDATVRVEVRFKNARLYNAIATQSVCVRDTPRAKALHAVGPIKAFCDLHELNLEAVYRLLNLRDSPFLRGRRRQLRLRYRPICERLAFLLDAPVEWLFPRDLYARTWPTLATDVRLTRLIPLASAPKAVLQLPAAQIDHVATCEQNAALLSALSTLTPREEVVLQVRYGLDNGVEETYHAIGDAMGISTERVRQIEHRALRKLRQRLRPFWDETE